MNQLRMCGMENMCRPAVIDNWPEPIESVCLSLSEGGMEQW